MGLPGMVVSAISAVAGAIMYWAMTAQSSGTIQNHGFRASTVGIILMIAGGVGFLVSFIVFTMSNRAPLSPNRSIDRTTTDEVGRTTELHEQQSASS